MVLPGKAGALNRTARRVSREGSSGHAACTAARETKAIVHSPWMMIPGNPTDFANSASVWIGIVSPDASAYR